MKIAVVGAGPSGAAAAHALAIKGHDVLVLEGQKYVGGRTHSFRKNGLTLDTGAGFVTNFYPRLMSLSHDLDFNSSIQEMNRVSGLVRDGTLATMNIGSALSFMRFPFVSALDKFKMASWLTGLTMKRKRYDLANPSTLIPHDVQNIADYARSRLTENLYHALIRPGIEPFWYFSCEEVSAGLLVALSAHAAGAKFYVFPCGIDVICNSLLDSDNVDGNIRLNLSCDALVEKIQKTPAGYRVHYRSGDKEAFVDADQVVVATTASVANAITADLSLDDVSVFQRSFLNDQRYASNIHACFEIDSLSKAPKVSAVFPCGSGRHQLAAISFHRFKSELPVGRTELISVYLSDSASKEMMTIDDGTVYERCWDLARASYGDLPSSYQPFHLTRRQEAIPIHAVGRYKLAAQFNDEQRGKAIRFCGDYLTTATIEGAIASGWGAAACVDDISAEKATDGLV